MLARCGACLCDGRRCDGRRTWQRTFISLPLGSHPSCCCGMALCVGISIWLGSLLNGTVVSRARDDVQQCTKQNVICVNFFCREQGRQQPSGRRRRARRPRSLRQQLDFPPDGTHPVQQWHMTNDILPLMRQRTTSLMKRGSAGTVHFRSQWQVLDWSASCSWAGFCSSVLTSGQLGAVIMAVRFDQRDKHFDRSSRSHDVHVPRFNRCSEGIMKCRPFTHIQGNEAEHVYKHECSKPPRRASPQDQGLYQ